MKFVQFERVSNGNKKDVLGVELMNNGKHMIVDLNLADPSIPIDMRTFLDNNHNNLIKTLKVIENMKCLVAKEDVKLLSPITNPDKLICIGMNYKDHCEEMKAELPLEPVVFSKFSSCIVGPTDDVIYPKETTQLDWEVELVIIVGKEGKNISHQEAMSHVFGYTVGFDVSARDWQLHKNGQQWLLGKSMDTFCPLGPCIVMKEDIADVENLGIRCRVNGVVKQNSNTAMIVHGVEKLIVFLSRFVTLKPGDVILTGTPLGVGVSRKHQEFLKRGDVVECEVDEIGTIRNQII